MVKSELPSSSIATGKLRHRRRRPRPHQFTYGCYHALIDVDELDRLDREVSGFGYNRAALTSFRDTDHFGPTPAPVRTKLALWLEDRGTRLPGGRVLVLTNLRVLGHVFNPVSFWFCHDPSGALRLIVAEVNNTFGESYSYLLTDLEERPDGRVTAARTKRFHVSPFMPVDGLEYRFTFRLDADRVSARIDVTDREGPLFDATVGERLEPMTTRTTVAALLRHPLMTVRTVVAIHWQALRLWLKRTPFFRKPAPPENHYGSTSPAVGRGDDHTTDRLGPNDGQTIQEQAS